MHKYLRAIGFSQCKNNADVRKILQAVCSSPSFTTLIPEGDDVYGYIGKSFGDHMGLKLLGIYGDGHHFHEEYYFPYVESNVVSSRIPIDVERHSDHLAYSGISDDPSMGISLIFYLNNGLELIQRQNNDPSEIIDYISLNALSTSGKILLPLYKSDSDLEESKVTARQRMSLVDAARSGDEAAIENLAMQDMAIIHSINERISREDIYTLVDTYFMPFGLDSDQYAVMGEIRKAEQVTNRMTGEICWLLTLECNRLLMTVLINSEDLLGAPAVGRRFKGEIWLQGTAVLKE